MSYTTLRPGPEFTPDLVKNIIFATIGLSLACALLNEAVSWLVGGPGPEYWLSLSWSGLKHFFLWQPVSFLFIQKSGFQGITFGFLFSLAIQMYLLWIMGSDIFERLGKKAFLILYFGSGALAGVATILIAALFGYGPLLAGAAPALLALATVWAMLHPEMEVLLFFILPVKVKWLVAGIIGAILLIHLSSLDLIHLVFYLSGAVFGYLYAVIIHQLSSPFPLTHSFEERLRFGKKEGKIIDFHTGREIPNSDDQFVDEMLEKIAKKGQASLTRSEKKRMEAISKKMQKKQ